jgi:hypothetical protein
MYSWQYDPSISISLEPLRSIWLANNLRQTRVKQAVTSWLQTLDTDFFYTGQQAFLPQRDKYLNVSVD